MPIKAKAPTFTELVNFAIQRGLALKAIQEMRQRDPDNLWVQEKEKAIQQVTTLDELNRLLVDECEDDWLEGFVRERSVPLVEELLGIETEYLTLTKLGR